VGQIDYDRVSVQGTAIGLVRPFSRLFYARSCMGHDHISPQTKSQGHRSWLRVMVSKGGKAVGLISILDQWQFMLPIVLS